MAQFRRHSSSLLTPTLAFGALLFVSTAAAQSPNASSASSSSPAMQQTGQKISLDLKGVDILDVLKLLSQKSGLNFVAGRNVSGRITIFVNNVDVWDAFELIIGANDLAYERHGDIITVMMARDYELIFGEKFQERKHDVVQRLKYGKVVQVATVLNQIKSSVGRVVADEATNTLIISDVPTRLQEMQDVVKQLDRPTESRVYKLNYTEADKLKEKVQEVLSPIGTFTFDARTNTVVISDLREVLEKTDRIIQAFDVADGQVLIEARIVNVTLTDDKSLGIDWQRIFGGVDLQARSNLLTRGDVIAGDIISGAGTGSAIQLTSGKGNAKALIEALNKIGKTDTLSNPRIMVSNNQEAKILVGTKEAFITTTTTVPATGSTVSAPQVQTEDVGTKLFVTPNIKRDGYVQLKIRPEVSSVARTITNIAGTVVPIVQTTEAETNVLVKSGVTLIIGGLIDTKTQQTDNEVPWLGSVPVLGTPFRGQVRQKNKSELVVFLTPQIILPDGSPYVPPAAASSAVSAAASATSLAQQTESQGPVSAAYRQTIRQRLQEQLANQFKDAGLSKGSVVVAFLLNKDGQIEGTPDIASPEGDVFIAAAKEALQQAQPFPAFPEHTEADKVRFRVAIEYLP